VERGEAEAIYEQGREVVVAVLLRMDEQIQALSERVARQDERIAQLERRVGRSSRNSSRPPSQDPPGAAPKRGKDRSGRKPGAQPGHEGKGRGLLPAWAVDEVIEHWPDRCDCGHRFSDAERVAIGAPARHQVEELPVMSVRVTEHRGQRVWCPGCGAKRTGALPVEVAASAFGPRLQAAVVTLSVRNRISRRDVVELCEQLFAARVSTGAVEAILSRAGDAMGDPYEDLLGRVRASNHLNMDETGWRLRGKQRALWGAFTDRHAVLQIAADRHEDHARDLLADSQAIVTSDRWWAYDHLPLRRRQICWAHLQRDFIALATGSAPNRNLQTTACGSATSCSGPGRCSSTPATVASCGCASVRCAVSSSRSCAATRARTSATSTAAGSRATCSRSGPRSGRSRRSTACSPPTTTPNARYAAP
jgi:transposase